MGIGLEGSESSRIFKKALGHLKESPRTITADICSRSSGGPNDFYSEGDYWWPDPKKPTGPYIKRDGETNPDNFVSHRLSLIHFSEVVGTLTSAYLLSNEVTYVDTVREHLRAWFINPKTRMNPSMEFAQAIQGICSGRSIGIIDTIHLCEVIRSVKVLKERALIPSEELMLIEQWVRGFVNWLNNHEYGREEKVHPNNHGVCWSLQVAVFIDLIGDDELKTWIRQQCKEVYIGEMMNEEGGFTEELSRTKPYCYSLFILDILVCIVHILSDKDDNLWEYETESGHSIKKALDFMVTYMEDKSKWLKFKPKDIMHWEEWPFRHSFLLFGYERFQDERYENLWNVLPSDSDVTEVLRNVPIRHPLLWV